MTGCVNGLSMDFSKSFIKGEIHSSLPRTNVLPVKYLYLLAGWIRPLHTEV
jgi:hypothetical protein